MINAGGSPYPGVEARAMSRHVGPATLIVFAGLADAAGRSDLAFYALLAAVPIVAGAALAAYGDLVAAERPVPAPVSLQALLWGLGLVLVVASAAVRAPAFDSVAPALGASTLTACLAIVGLQFAVAAAGELRSEGELRRGFLGQVDQRLDGEERADRDRHAREHRRLEERLARR
jgi:hypothetical protein